MVAKITPAKGALTGSIKAPPSKSHSHRLLICSALATGTSTLHGISDSEDILATIDLLRGLGAKIQKNGDTVTVIGTDLTSPSAKVSSEPLSCRESASTLRFILPLCLLLSSPVTLTGSQRLLSRPLEVYKTLCRENGLTFEASKDAVRVCGRLCGGNYSIRGDISSQFISGLLFALPLCREDSVLHVIPRLESKPYIDITLATLKKFGIDIDANEPLVYKIRGGQAYKASSAEAEGDYSNAAFFHALNLLGHKVSVTGLDPSSLQGDKIYSKYFSLLSEGTPVLDVSECPDLAPILMTLAAAGQGATLVGTRRLATKESDRGRAMADELAKFGAKIAVLPDSIVINKSRLCAPREPLLSHNDHRIVMSLATLATVYGGEIHGAEAVRKSLPNYFELLSSLGAAVHLYEP